MILRRVRPCAELAPYVEKLWLFESSAGIPPGDLRTIVPNGLMKLIVSYRGSLTSARASGPIRRCPEGSMSLVGLMEQPVTIDSGGPTGTIGVELKPTAAYRFFPFRLKDVTNGVALAEEVLDSRAREMQRRLADEPTVEGKLDLVQRFLVSLLRDRETFDPLVEWAVGEIQRTGGTVTVADLCRESGYSKRYLDLRFSEHVGLGPKAVAGITRFLPVFRRYSQRAGSPLQFPEAYYDQSHFIREFKRYTGRTPTSYLRALNDFGEIFYRES